MRKAPHVDAKWTDVVNLMAGAMSGNHLLCHVGHYTNGFEDIAVDAPDTPTADVQEYLRTARLLSTCVSDLESDLVKFSTGALIRVVLQAAPGAAYCDAVVPDRHVIGFLRIAMPQPPMALTDVPDVRPADALTAELTSELRRLIRRRHAETPAMAEVDDTAPTIPPDVPFDAVHTTGHLTGRLAEQCREVVDPGDLHHVSCWENGNPVYAVDVLTHPGVSRFLTESDSVARLRRFYEQLGRRFPELVSQFGRVCHNALGGKLERVVLALEQGAIYYYRGRPGQYLVGVTLNDEEVTRSDEKVARLAVTARTQ